MGRRSAVLPFLFTLFFRSCSPCFSVLVHPVIPFLFTPCSAGGDTTLKPRAANPPATDAHTRFRTHVPRPRSKRACSCCYFYATRQHTRCCRQSEIYRRSSKKQRSFLTRRQSEISRKSSRAICSRLEVASACRTGKSQRHRRRTQVCKRGCRSASDEKKRYYCWYLQQQNHVLLWTVRPPEFHQGAVL